MTVGTAPEMPSRDARFGRRRLAVRVGFAVLCVAVLAYYSVREPLKSGDGWEYAYQVESLYRHGTPELRPDDQVAANALFVPEGWRDPPAHPYGYFPTPDGRLYGMHFWA